jgi:very-short-patch-repair endonuclease
MLRNNLTKAEAILWRELKNKKLLGFKFRRQYGIGAYVVDFYCTELNLAVEVDGVTHSTDQEREYDSRREADIGQLGIQLLRFTNPENYEDLHNVLEKIKTKVTEIHPAAS